MAGISTDEFRPRGALMTTDSMIDIKKLPRSLR